MSRSEQRPDLFEIGQDLTSEGVDGFAFEEVDIIASMYIELVKTQHTDITKDILYAF